MKLMLISWLILFSHNSYALKVSAVEFQQMSEAQQIKILQVYSELWRSLPVEVSSDIQTTSRFLEFISRAYADNQNYNCFYAGWPSVKKKVSGSHSVCSSPASGNSDYQAAACGRSSLQCQPLLFGDGLCASTSTRQSRNSAFVQCENQFKKSGRKISEIAAKLARPEMSNKAQELFSTVERICSEKPAPAICRSLENKVALIKAGKIDEVAIVTKPEVTETAQLVPAENGASVEVARSVSKIEHALSEAGKIDCNLEHDHGLDQVRQVAQIENDDVEDEMVFSEGFPRITSGLEVACTSTRSIDGYKERSVFDCTDRDAGMLPGGFSFLSNDKHPHFQNLNPYGSLSKPYRQIDIQSNNHALNETFLYLHDISQGPDSHDVKSMMFLLPRKSPPSVTTSETEVQITLSTGEKVTFDRATSAIISGALKEGPPDFNLDRFKRKPANVNYAGAGISIRLSHRFETPTMAAETADVVQGTRSCKIPRGQLFDASGKLMTDSDRGMLDVINSKCPAKAGQKPFSL